jgi:hypothetical protein
VQARQQREAEAAAETRRIEGIKTKRHALLAKILLWFWLTVLGIVLSAMIVGAIWLYKMKGN